MAISFKIFFYKNDYKKVKDMIIEHYNSKWVVSDECGSIDFLPEFFECLKRDGLNTFDSIFNKIEINSANHIIIERYSPEKWIGIDFFQINIKEKLFFIENVYVFG